VSKLAGAVHLEITLPFMFIIITLKIKNQEKIIIIFLKLNIASLLVYCFFLPPKIRLQEISKVFLIKEEYLLGISSGGDVISCS